MSRARRGTGEQAGVSEPLQPQRPGYSEGTALAVNRTEVSLFSGPVAARRETAGHQGGAARHPFSVRRRPPG